jgi:hypothetical protein
MVGNCEARLDFQLIDYESPATCEFARHRTERSRVLRNWAVCSPIEGRYRPVLVDGDRKRRSKAY